MYMTVTLVRLGDQQDPQGLPVDVGARQRQPAGLQAQRGPEWMDISRERSRRVSTPVSLCTV